MSILSATDICKSYGSLEVLQNVSLAISQGEIVAITGPSGAGKTTLLQILSTLDVPTSGSVRYFGDDTEMPVDVTSFGDKKLSSFRNQNIGFVFQFHMLLEEFTLQENVALPALIGGVKRRKALDRAAALLESLGLGDRFTHHPSQLSGGERQRGALARALINDPKIVFADEPTGALDSANAQALMDLMLDLRDTTGRTFVIVTHDNTLAARTDRIITLADGRIV